MADTSSTSPQSGGNGQQTPKPKGALGVGSEPDYLLASPRGIRHRCRDVLAILQFRHDEGEILTRDEAAALIRAGATLAEKSANCGRVRDYRAAMSVLAMLARMEQREEPVRHEHAHLHAGAEAKARLDELIGRLTAEARRRGLIREEPAT